MDQRTMAIGSTAFPDRRLSRHAFRASPHGKPVSGVEDPVTPIDD